MKDRYTVVMIVQGEVEADSLRVAKDTWKTLEEYLELVRRDDAGGRAHEVYQSSTGATLTITASTHDVTKIPYEGTRLRDLIPVASVSEIETQLMNELKS